MNTKLIEHLLPLDLLGDSGTKEKANRRGNISALHIWWARKPLGLMRATILSSILSSKIDNNNKLEFIKYCLEGDENLKKINNYFNGKLDDVWLLDPFGGGGSIPLAGIQLGLNVWSNDLNPVATLLQNAALKFPLVYDGERPLNEEIEKWGLEVFNRSYNEMKTYFPDDNQGNIPLAYYWFRTVNCKNPFCGAEIPLTPQYWLCNTEQKKIALKPWIDKTNNSISFSITDKIDFDPSEGTIKQGKAKCPVCQTVLNSSNLREIFTNKLNSQRLVAVIYTTDKGGKHYRIATKEDEKAFILAQDNLDKKVKKLTKKWGISPVPDEPLPQRGSLGFRIQGYGFKTWGDMFNSRQKLSLLCLIEAIDQVRNDIKNAGYSEENTNIITTYLGIILSRCTDFSNTFCEWHNTWQMTAHIFSRPAIPMKWNYSELNLWAPMLTGTWSSMTRVVSQSVEMLCKNKEILKRTPQIKITNSSATKLLDYKMDYIITDPPYYDNVPYSDLSDFFYVWLKRVVGKIYPELFVSQVTPKGDEVISNFKKHVKSSTQSATKVAKEYFYETLLQSFKSCRNIIKNDGLFVVIFAHQSSEAWESLINAIWDSEFSITASWPIKTELKSRLRAHSSAALASTIILVCRPVDKTKLERGYFLDVKTILEKELNEKLEFFWNNNISGGDFYIASIGAGLKIVTRYNQILYPDGTEFSLTDFFIHLRKIASKFLLKKVTGDFNETDYETNFYILWFITFAFKNIAFDEGRKFSHGLGIDLNSIPFLWKKEKETIRLLRYFEIEINKEQNNLLRLFKMMMLWEMKKYNEIEGIISETVNINLIWITAQILYNIFPDKSKEQQLLQGLMYSYKK